MTGSERGVSDALSRLVDEGIVLVRDAGPARLHQLNRDHIAASLVLEMAQLRSRLLARLRYALGLWDPAPMHASLFGDAACGTGDASCAIDLLLIARDTDIADERWLDQVDGLREDVHRWTGNGVQLVVLSDSERLDLLDDESPDALLPNVRADAVDLAGEPAAQFLRPPTG
ncbi:MAG: hypothetical protein ACEQSX_02815 [Baekduiaceae bacterium]